MERELLQRLAAITTVVLVGWGLAACGGGAGREQADGELKAAELPDKLVVGFLPLENPETLATDADAFAEYLADELGMSVVAFVPTEYAALVEALRSGSAHVAFMGSLAVVMANEFADAVPILGEIQRGDPFYNSQYYVRADSDIHALAGLEGQDVAFTSPTSGSGFVFPIGMVVDDGLLDSGADPREFFGAVLFAGGDEQVLHAVLRGDVVGGATSNYAPGQFLDAAQQRQLRVIATKQVPPHAVVVSNDLPVEFVERLRAVLLKMNEGEGLATLKAVYGADGFVEVGLEDYQPVVDAARAAGFDLADLIK